jgi:chorismate mutase/prephenate dehydratase
MSTPEPDQTVEQLRARIADVDRAIVDRINERLELVAELWRYKEAHGLPVLAPAREEWMLTYLARANSGPLSEEGLRAIYAEVLALTKRELGA